MLDDDGRANHSADAACEASAAPATPVASAVASPAASALPPSLHLRPSQQPAPSSSLEDDAFTTVAIADYPSGGSPIAPPPKADSNGPGGTAGSAASNPPAPLVRVPTEACVAADSPALPAFKSALRRFLIVFLVVSAIVVTLTQVLEIRSVVRVHESSSTLRAENTRGTLWQLAVLHDRVVSAESSARGFVITGEPQFLTHYNDSIASARNHFDEMARSLPEEQQASVASVHRIFVERIAILDGVIATRKQNGFDLDQVTSQVILGEDTMTNLTSQLMGIYNIAQAERTDMLDSLHVASTWVRFTAIATLCGMVLLLLFGVGGALTFNERELRQRNVVLQDLLQKTQSAAMLKADFLTNISHELRTPMNGVLAMCHVLLHTSLTSEQRECLDTVLESANSMMRLINDLLLCSKMGAGQFALNPTPVKIARLLKHIHDTMKVRVRAAAHDPAKGHIEWKIEQDAALPTSIIVDSDRVKQVLLNLCDNALKFTSTGSIVLAVRLRKSAASKPVTPQASTLVAPPRPETGSQPPTPANRAKDKDECKETALTMHDASTPNHSAPNHATPAASSVPAVAAETVNIEFSVKDTGIGIPASALASIFEAFSQGDMSMTKRYSGQGLGLTVCRQLINEMGSELRVQSQEGQGSRFWFTITVPLPDSDHTESPTGTATDVIYSPGPSPAFNSVMARVCEEEDEVAPLPEAQELADPTRRSTLLSSCVLSFDDTAPSSVNMSQPGLMLEGCSLDHSGMLRRRLSSSSLQFFSPQQYSSTTSNSRSLRDLVHLPDCTCMCASVGNATYAPVQVPSAVGLPSPPQQEHRDEGSVVSPAAAPTVGSIPESSGSTSHNPANGSGWVNDLSSISVGSQFSSTMPASVEGQRYSRAQSCSDWVSFNTQMESMKSQFNRAQSQLFTPPAPSRKPPLTASSWTPDHRGLSRPMMPPPISIAAMSAASSNDLVSRADGDASHMLPAPALSMLHASRSNQELPAIRTAAMVYSSPPPAPARSPNPSPSFASTPISASSTLPRGRPLRILCAEDNLVNQKVLLKLLSREGHTTVMTDDGLQAVQQYEAHSPDYFDIVLLDMCMPVMDGVTACQRIRELEQQRRAPHSATYSMAGTASPPLLLAPSSPLVDSRVAYPSRTLGSPPVASSPLPSTTSGGLSSSPTCPRIPIVAVTASALLEDKQVCVQAGMDDVIIKPLTPAALRHVLKPIRNRVNQNAPPAPAPPPLMFPVSAMQALINARAAQAAEKSQQQAPQTSAMEPAVPAAAVASAAVAAAAAPAPTDAVARDPADPRPMMSGRPSVHRAVSADAAVTPRSALQLTPRLPRAASASANATALSFPAPPPSVAAVQPLLPSDPPPAQSPPQASPPPPQHLMALLSSALVTTPPNQAGNN